MLFDNLLDKIKGLMLVHSNSIKANDDKNAADTASAIEKVATGVELANTKIAGHDTKLDYIVEALDRLKAQQDRYSDVLEAIARQTAKKERAPRKKKVTDEVPTTGEMFNENMEVNPEATTGKSETESTKERKPRINYTDEENQFIIENYPKMTTEKLVVALKEKFGIERNHSDLQKHINQSLKLNKYKKGNKTVKVEEVTVEKPKVEEKKHKKRGREPKLTAEQSNLTVEKYFEGKSFTKIAVELNVAPHLVRDNIRRTRGIKKGDFANERSKDNLSLPLRSNTKYSEEDNKRIRLYIDRYGFTAETIGIIMRRSTDAIKCQGRVLGYSTQKVGKTTIFTKSNK